MPPHDIPLLTSHTVLPIGHCPPGGASAGAAPAFFFNDTATTETSTLSLPDALPIWPWPAGGAPAGAAPAARPRGWTGRKSTRLNSSHLVISYAVFCLKKKRAKAMLWL